MASPYIGVMDGQPLDPDLERIFADQARDGRFASVEKARADFDAKMGEALAELDAGIGIDADIVFAELRERYANWPRAAE